MPRSVKMEAGAFEFNDDDCVPVLRRVETVVPLPFGKDVLLVAEKV